jgi:hypothetical protein
MKPSTPELKVSLSFLRDRQQRSFPTVSRGSRKVRYRSKGINGGSFDWRIQRLDHFSSAAYYVTTAMFSAN